MSRLAVTLEKSFFLADGTPVAFGRFAGESDPTYTHGDPAHSTYKSDDKTSNVDTKTYRSEFLLVVHNFTASLISYTAGDYGLGN